jgi:hypothetical protein
LSLVGCGAAVSYGERDVQRVRTVNVGFDTEVAVDDSASTELASSARTMAASAAVAPIAKRIVLACCLG